MHTAKFSWDKVSILSIFQSTVKDAMVARNLDGIKGVDANGVEATVINYSDGTASGELRPYYMMTLHGVSSQGVEHKSSSVYWGRFTRLNDVTSPINWQGFAPALVQKFMAAGRHDANFIYNVLAQEEASMIDTYFKRNTFDVIREFRDFGIVVNPIGKFVTLPETTGEFTAVAGLFIDDYKVNDNSVNSLTCFVPYRHLDSRQEIINAFWTQFPKIKILESINGKINIVWDGEKEGVKSESARALRVAARIANSNGNGTTAPLDDMETLRLGRIDKKRGEIATTNKELHDVDSRLKVAQSIDNPSADDLQLIDELTTKVTELSNKAVDLEAELALI